MQVFKRACGAKRFITFANIEMERAGLESPELDFICYALILRTFIAILLFIFQ